MPPSSPSGARWHEPAKQSRFVDSCFQTWTLHGRTSVTDRADPQAGSASLLPGQISKRRAFPYDPVSLGLPFPTAWPTCKPGRLHFCPGRFQKDGRFRTALCRWTYRSRRHGGSTSRVGFTSARADFKKKGVPVRPCVAGACPFRRHGRSASRVGFTSAQAEVKAAGDLGGDGRAAGPLRNAGKPHSVKYPEVSWLRLGPARLGLIRFLPPRIRRAHKACGPGPGRAEIAGR